MNLLMITRKIDRDDWLAGHSYNWAKKMAEQLLASYGQLSVICLERGNVDGLGPNVKVFSLGKEMGSSRRNRFWEFQKLAKKLVPGVDGIFAHQNPEYAIAVWPWARLYHKRIISWYTHKSVTWKSRIMLALSDKVLTASKESFRLASPKVEVVGHGIDVDKFKTKNEKRKAKNSKFRIITVGRISPVKDLETLILAMKQLIDYGQKDFHLDIIGAAALATDKAYLESLKILVKRAELEEQVIFLPPLPHHQIGEVYASADLFVNLSQTGSLDKAVLEAMAGGCPVITSNEAFFEILRPYSDLTLSRPNDAKDLGEKILRFRQLNASDRAVLTANLRQIVEKNHNLDILIRRIIGFFA